MIDCLDCSKAILLDPFIVVIAVSNKWSPFLFSWSPFLFSNSSYNFERWEFLSLL